MVVVVSVRVVGAVAPELASALAVGLGEGLVWGTDVASVVVSGQGAEEVEAAAAAVVVVVVVVAVVVVVVVVGAGPEVGLAQGSSVPVAVPAPVVVQR